MKFIFSFFLCVFLLGCQETETKKITSIPFLPNEAGLIFKVNDFTKARSLFQNNALLQKNKSNTLYNYFKNLSPFNLLTAKEHSFYLCFSPLGKNDFGFSLITENNETAVSESLIEKHLSANKNYNDFPYKELKINNQILYAALLNNTWVLSSEYLLMENHIKQFQNNIVYQYPKAIESLNDENISVILINSEIKDISKRLFPTLSNTHLFNETITGWTAGEFTIDKNSLDINAIYKPGSNQNDIGSIFKNILPQNNRLAEITPVSALQFTSFTFDDYNELAKNLNAYIGGLTPSKTSTEFLTELTEFGSIQLLKNNVFACRVPNESIELSTYFETEENPTKFRDFSIYKLKEAINFGDLLQPLHSVNNYQYYIQYNEFIIFALAKEGLMELIPSLKNKNTLANKEWYKNFSDQLTGQSVVLNVTNSGYANTQIKNVINKEFQKNWNLNTFKNYNVAAFQLVPESSFSHLRLVTSKTIKTATDFKVNEVANFILNADLKTKPQWVTNYISKTKDLVLQDAENKLLLISNEGEIKWEKEINEAILGDIQQMDIYRNGRLQYVFTTPSKLYVLDRKGNEVAPYPISFKKPITQPVALFDYDNNRKYRILVTQDNQLTMYQNSGKVVNGFKFKNKSQGTITHTPKHIRVGKKDYIVVNESNTGIHFLNRTGKERIKLKTTPLETTKEWFWYNNSFATLNAENTITQIKTDGSLTTETPPIADATAADISIDTTTKTWVSFFENKLNIKTKIIELEFGTYTQPKIFFINNKIYVTITNKDTKKVYLFDSNAKPINGFPVYGIGPAVIENTDKDTNLELAVQGDSNSILFYEFK